MHYGCSKCKRNSKASNLRNTLCNRCRNGRGWNGDR